MKSLLSVLSTGSCVKYSLLVLLTLPLLASGQPLYPQGPPALQRAIIPEVMLDQDAIDANAIPLLQIMEAGRHLFTTPFTTNDGAGEGRRIIGDDGRLGGPMGPREIDFNQRLNNFIRATRGDAAIMKQFLAPATAIRSNGIVVLDTNDNVRFDFLRINGLDSQSCFECHNSIGSDHLPGQGASALLARKVGVTGGSAGFVSDAFISEQLATNDTNVYPFTMFLRNPPHVFGTGYVQALAVEMTDDLQMEKEAAIGAAYDNQGKWITNILQSKGVSFGSYSVLMTSEQRKEGDRADVIFHAMTQPELVTEDFSHVVGVSTDLVVRPLQWKGIASNERNFVHSALAFHFGMHPRELDPNYGDTNEVFDDDSDMVTNEVTEGEVTALTVFTMLIRPPTDPENLTPEEERGRYLFTNLAGLGPSMSCALCHVPKLRLTNTMAFVRDPRMVATNAAVYNLAGLVAAQATTEDLPVIVRLREVEKNLKAQNKTLHAFKSMAEAEKAANVTLTNGYWIDLSLTNYPIESGQNPLSLSYPRLPRESDGTVIVPLFSDLKRHNMGSGLADKYSQTTDVATVKVATNEFLTRPLWGVADTGPWLHDGRARTLKEAILMHDSPGSDATPIIEKFRALSDGDQRAIITFLLALRLPLDNRYSFDSP